MSKITNDELKKIIGLSNTLVNIITIGELKKYEKQAFDILNTIIDIGDDSILLNTSILRLILTLDSVDLSTSILKYSVKTLKSMVLNHLIELDFIAEKKSEYNIDGFEKLPETSHGTVLERSDGSSFVVDLEKPNSKYRIRHGSGDNLRKTNIEEIIQVDDNLKVTRRYSFSVQEFDNNINIYNRNFANILNEIEEEDE